MLPAQLRRADDFDEMNCVVASEPGFDFLAEEYHWLYTQSCATAFQSPEWLHAFYKTLAPALGAEAIITTLRHCKTRELKAVLPFVRQQSMGAKIVQPADLGVSDYNQLVASQNTLQSAAENPVMAAQIVEQLKPFDALIMRKQRSDGHCISNLFKKAVLSPNENSAYDVKVERDFETWFATGVSKNFRSCLRRKQRKFVKDHGELTPELVTSSDEIDAAFDFMRQSREGRFTDDLFCRDEYFSFYRAFADLTAETGKSFTFVCRANGRIVSAEFGLLDQGTCLMVHGAFDPEFLKYSLGNVSLINLIKHLRSIGLNHFDFTIGDHDYKQRFKARETTLTNAVLSNSPLGKLVGLTYRNGGGIKRLLARLSPHVN